MISIVILCHNQQASTKRCIDSLFKYTKEDYVLCLVDNGSTDNTLDYMKDLVNKNEDKKIQIFENKENLGFVKANNYVMEQRSDNDILLLNNDIEILKEGWLRKLKEGLYDEDIGLTFPINRTRGIPYCGGLIENKKEKLLRYDTDDKNKELTWAQFSCVLIKSEVIKKIGLLDERYDPGYFEDVDYCLRLKDAGYKMKLIQDVMVEHYQSVTSKNLKLDHYRFTNREKFYKKWDDKF